MHTQNFNMYENSPTILLPGTIDADENRSGKVSLNNSLIEYERVKVVGKGAFGTAVLCKRHSDGELVIVKEIPMLTLSAGERQMALNEAKVLSKLKHPNIVLYHSSYEVDGILMIEMEYADGGNLQEFMAQLENRLDEMTVLTFFKQITSAVVHLHEKRIIHRDLKAANIFMTSQQIIKVGDFGISKVVSTQATKANTVVGTPYYLSPEMCEGKPYNDKSDIWALGCILYEMACLHRTFDATNLPALVQKITKGHFAPIDGDYSQEFRELIRDMLHQEASFRPSAKEILNNRLPPLIQQQKQVATKLSHSSLEQTSKFKRSVLYFVKFNDGFLDLIPVPLPPKIVIQQLAVGLDHMIALSSDFEVYVWGSNTKGQLGLDSLAPFVQHPVHHLFLRGKSVKMIGAGNGFSIFSCNNGIVMTCGDGSKGCLGHGDWNNTLKPKVLEKLLCINVTAVACGANHVVVIGDERWVFAWGCGLNGRLGHGTEETICLPMEIGFSEKVTIRKVYCGSDGTLFISSKGKAWACGNNADNKMGLDSGGRITSLKKKQIDQALIPTRVFAISRSITEAYLGAYHTVFILENGQIVTCGRNKDGQLGHGHNQTDRSVEIVRAIGDTQISMVSCTETLTIVGTFHNAVLCWGSRFVDKTRSRSISKQYKAKTLVFDVTSKNNSDIQDGKFKHIDDSNIAILESDSSLPLIKKNNLNPEEILMLYASSSQIVKGEIIALSGLFTQGNQVYLVVSTTLPVPHRVACEKNPNFRKSSNQEVDFKYRKNSYNEDKMDSTAQLPKWLEKELEESDDLWKKSLPEEGNI